jgi:hypothetical protein
LHAAFRCEALKVYLSSAATARFTIPVPLGDGDCQTLASLIARQTTYLLRRFLFALLLLPLPLLALLDVALALPIDVLRTLRRLLFRFLITIRAARLLIHLALIFHGCSLDLDVKWCLKDWMEELVRILSGNRGAALEFESCGMNALNSAFLAVTWQQN